MVKIRPATFRIIRFPMPSGTRYVAIAWNYEEAVLISSGDSATSAKEARRLLLDLATSLHVELRWFDGEYTYRAGLLERFTGND